MILAGSIPLPHGGKLVNRFASSDKTDGMFTVQVSSDLRNDIENIADGVFSPLEGFVGEQHPVGITGKEEAGEEKQRGENVGNRGHASTKCGDAPS